MRDLTIQTFEVQLLNYYLPLILTSLVKLPTLHKTHYFACFCIFLHGGNSFETIQFFLKNLSDLNLPGSDPHNQDSEIGSSGLRRWSLTGEELLQSNHQMQLITGDQDLTYYIHLQVLCMRG